MGNKMEQTNLKMVKEVALIFLNMPIEETKFSPIVVYHPIFENGIISIKKDGNHEFVNIIEDKDGLKYVVEKYERSIKKCNSLMDVYMIIRKSYRLTFIKFIEEYLSIEDLSILLANAWVVSENPNQDVNCSLSLITRWFKKADKHILMNEEDYKIYQELPDTFKIYRGVAVGRNPKGLSWTRNYDRAVWFANRFNRNDKVGYVQVATVKKENVLAYFNTRSEDEIVVNTNDLIDIKTV